LTSGDESGEKSDDSSIHGAERTSYVEIIRGGTRSTYLNHFKEGEKFLETHAGEDGGRLFN